MEAREEGASRPDRHAGIPVHTMAGQEPRSGSGTAFVDMMQAVQHRGAPSDWSAEAPVRACRDGACGGAARVNDHRHQHQSRSRIRLVAIWSTALHITVYSWETVHPARRRGRWNRNRTRDPSWLRAKEQT